MRMRKCLMEYEKALISLTMARTNNKSIAHIRKRCAKEGSKWRMVFGSQNSSKFKSFFSSFRLVVGEISQSPSPSFLYISLMEKENNNNHNNNNNNNNEEDEELVELEKQLRKELLLTRRNTKNSPYRKMSPQRVELKKTWSAFQPSNLTSSQTSKPSISIGSRAQPLSKEESSGKVGDLSSTLISSVILKHLSVLNTEEFLNIVIDEIEEFDFQDQPNITLSLNRLDVNNKEELSSLLQKLLSLPYYPKIEFFNLSNNSYQLLTDFLHLPNNSRLRISKLSSIFLGGSFSLFIFIVREQLLTSGPSLSSSSPFPIIIIIIIRFGTFISQLSFQHHQLHRHHH